MRLMSLMIPDDVERALQMVRAYAPDLTQFVAVKVEVLKHLRWQTRTLFSRRHEITKKQQTNDFEREVMKRWIELGGKLDDT